MKTRLSHHRSLEVVLAAILLFSYAYFFPRWADPNQNSRLNMVLAVVDDGTFAIDKYVANTVDYAKYNGHYYSDKPPGLAFLGIPIYTVLRGLYATPLLQSLVTSLSNSPSFQATLREGGSGVYEEKVKFAITQVALSFFLAVVPSVILGLLLYRLGVYFGFTPFNSFLCVLVYGLLTPAFAYAGAFYGHQLSSALLAAAFYLACRAVKFSAWRLMAIGALLGYAVLTEYPTILVAAVLAVYTFIRLIRNRQALWIFWAAPTALLGLVGILLYNNAVFGGPFNLGYGYSENWTQQHETGFMSLTWPHWDAAWGMTFGVFRGLFILSPVLLWTIPGFVLWARRKTFRLEFFTALAVTLVMFLFNSSSAMWWGGFSIGPRYFLAALPFIALALGFSLEAWGHRIWFLVGFTITAAWSFSATWGMTLAGQAFPPDTIANPYADYLIPNWLQGNVARNLGTIMGISGLFSILPLGILLIVLMVAGLQLARRITR